MRLEYHTEINASPQHVWDTTFDASTYNEWTKAFSEGSMFEGTWAQGEVLHFIDPNVGGTKALVEVFDPPQRMFAKHIAVTDKDGNETAGDETAKKWIGSTEEYLFEAVEGGTKMTVVIETDEQFETMFAEGWPKALELLKQVCERK